MTNIESYMLKSKKDLSNLNTNMSDDLLIDNKIKDTVKKPVNVSEIVDFFKTPTEEKNDLSSFVTKEQIAKAKNNDREFIEERMQMEKIQEKELKISERFKELEKTREEMIKYALQFEGNKYVYGGKSLTNGVDCSGFTKEVYKKFGIDIPDGSFAQRNIGVEINDLNAAKPGDLICFNGHVALYAGNGNIIHAVNAKRGIVYESLSAYWKNRIVKIVRPNELMT